MIEPGHRRESSHPGPPPPATEQKLSQAHERRPETQVSSGFGR
jgi:hypothetical protein